MSPEFQETPRTPRTRFVPDLVGWLTGVVRDRVQHGSAAPLGLLDWGRKYLPRHFVLPPSQMHVWLGEQLDIMSTRRGVKLNVIGPRGGAKSTIGTLTYVLRAAVEEREPYIWIVSDTRHQAQAHLDNVKVELLDNEPLHADYAAATGSLAVAAGNRIRLTGGVTIESFGTGQRIRGRRRRAERPTLIVCDDLQNDGHMESALQRDHSRRWFHGTLLKAGTRRTNIVNLATALHRDALALELTRTPGWISRIFRAIVQWPERMDLWAEWEAIYCDVEAGLSRQRAGQFYEEHRAAMELGAELLWPAEEDLYTLMKMRVESGRAAFEREKQGSPINPDLCEWPEEYFGPHLWFDEWPARLQVKVLSLDPSKGHDARKGDYSAFVVLGVDVQGMLLAEADLARRPTPQMVADGAALVRRFQPQAFGVETNQFQELLADEFTAEFARHGLVGVLPWTLDNHVNKQVRIRRLGPYLSARRIRFKSNSPSTQLLVDQLRDFPHADHDDGPDALEMAIRLVTELLGAEEAGDGLGDRLRISE